MIIKSLSDQVYDYVLRKIRIGELKDGDKIEENALIDELGVSRTPIREALIQLTSDNFLENRPRKGYYVRVLDDKEMSDMWDVIAILDASALELVINGDTIDSNTMAYLNNCLTDVDIAIERRDYESYYKWQEEFHLTYLAKCGNKVLERELKALFRKTLRMTYYSSNNDRLFAVLAKCNQQHKEILEAIRNRDVATARSIAMDHWKNSIAWEQLEDAFRI